MKIKNFELQSRSIRFILRFMVKVHKQAEPVSRSRRINPQPSRRLLQVQCLPHATQKKDLKKEAKIIAYPWKTRWLKGRLFSNPGPEYLNMLLNMQAYIQQFNMKSYFFFDHPSEIYERPENGLIYFIEARQLDSDFRFPRTQKEKIYKWKKMNFPTLLPHHRPVIRYKVASSIKRDKAKNHLYPTPDPVFRMHLVEPFKNNFGFVLCHIRRMTKSEIEKEGKNAVKKEVKVEPEEFKIRNYLQEDRVMTRSSLSKPK